MFIILYGGGGLPIRHILLSMAMKRALMFNYLNYSYFKRIYDSVVGWGRGIGSITGLAEYAPFLFCLFVFFENQLT